MLKQIDPEKDAEYELRGELAKSSGYEQNLSYSDKSYYEDFFNKTADSNSFKKVYDVYV